MLPPDSSTRDLPFDLVFERFLQVAEGIQIFHFRLGAEFFGAASAHADVRIATQRTFLHVAVADFGVQHHLFERREIGICLGGERMSGSETISASGVPPRL